MYGEQHPSRVALREAREATIEQLSESFARDELSLEEFESRLDRAYASAHQDEIRLLVSDLTVAANAPRAEAEAAAAPGAAIATAPRTASHTLARASEPKAAIAIFGNVERRGRWALATKSQALAVFGNAVLDLRGAILEPGITEIDVKAVFGNVEIIVPPTLCVECHGASIFGNFEALERLPTEPDGSPTLRVTGKAVFGNVEIRTQLRGERLLVVGHKPQR
jgi:hypothetical protein